MEQQSNLFAALIDLDVRHDELLERLDDLDRRVEKALHDWLDLDSRARNKPNPAVSRDAA